MHNHTCTTLEPGACKACEALTDAWVMDTYAEAVRTGAPSTEDIAALIPGRSERITDVMSGRYLGGQALELLADMGTSAGDPQRRYDTERDAQRAALRMVRNAPETSVSGMAARACLDTIRAAVRSGMATRGTVGSLPTEEDARDTMRPDMTRADARMVKAAVKAAYRETSALASAAYRPDASTGEVKWSKQRREDARTLAGPVVHGVRGFIVGPDGTTERATLPVRVTRDMVKCTGKGEDRARIEWTEVLTRKADLTTARAALTIRAARTQGTRWTPDASTYRADAFTEALEPSGAVRKPSNRKRRKDGRMGGSAVITSTPGRGAR